MFIGKIKKELRQGASEQKARDLRRFFKTGPGEYAEGDKFLGVMVPQTRGVVANYWKEISLVEIAGLLTSKFHEERLLALLVMVKKFEKGAAEEQKKIFDLYLASTKHINNWDLVDLSAPRIVGAYLEGKDKMILEKLANSKNLWERRIAMLAVFWFISKGEPSHALKIVEILVNDKEDLIHKAVGWGLREIGKRCGQDIEEGFLKNHYKTMPRTMLRYAIERFDGKKRQYYLRRD
ncbi:MAG: DNA alkylation repair protein [Candidatus Pacebacteria bacterium]|jgi:3-methyladenine DNA glycosylase AlkD|nr:DNA alkylation repair protein [Candidatus Paceibacterota bacterium]